MDKIVYLNGELVPASRACISIFDHGFLYGYGLFETMRAYQGRIFLLERHLKRLICAATTIGINGCPSEEELAVACRETLKTNGLAEARIRLTITHGESESMPWSGNNGKPTVVVMVRRYTPLPSEKYELGYKAMISSLRPGRMLSGVKSTAYLVSVLARAEAEKYELDEALLRNGSGFITEGSLSNVFFVGQSGLVTPPLASGILPGITREAVIGMAKQLDIKTEERDISPDEINEFNEAFLTNSMMEIMPMVSVRNEAGEVVIIGTGKPGPVTKRLMAAYRETVKEQTVKQ